MKEMIKKVRERREGFTMAELLIVVAIIAVLVAIAIPVFNGQLEKSRDAVSVSNLRAAYAEASAAKIGNASAGAAVLNSDGSVTVSGVVFKGTDNNAEYSGQAKQLPFEGGVTTTEPAAGTYKIKFTWNSGGTVTAEKIS